jgi:CRP-like cAMP-binding protein
MTSSSPTRNGQDVSGLVAAIARNTEDWSLGRFLEDYRWSVLADYVTPSRHERGHLLIAQGERDRTIYFLESGNLKVDMKTDGGLVHLAVLGPGTVVGEGGFFSTLPRNASVSVYSDCKVWAMGIGKFAELARQHPSVALALTLALGAVLSSRMLDVSKRLPVT